ncbi:MAG: GGDEF domain-containing phosphodiesterase [Pseudomonadales bacterium]
MTTINSELQTAALDSGEFRQFIRAQFLDRLSGDIADAAKNKESVALLLVDIKQVGQLNAKYGFNVVDEILVHAQDSLTAGMKKASLVDRLGDNVFCIVLPSMKSPAFLPLAADKVRRILATIEFNDDAVKLNCHIGAAVSQEGSIDADQMLLLADRSLKTAKIKQSQDLTLPVDEKSKIDAQWEMERELSIALDNNDLQFHYQPKISLADMRPTSAEALMRWDSEELGPVSPDQFIAVAEKTDLIGRISEWALKAVAREKSEMDKEITPVSLAINLSANDIYDVNLLGWIDAALGLWRINPKEITLEITEGVILENPEEAFMKMQAIREKGIRISIDDFGTGYSSLSYFKSIPADELKIDKSFIIDMHKNEHDKAIVELIIALAKKFGLQVVAEGVETREAMLWLRSKGCDFAQGYYFSRPLPAEEFMQWITEFAPEKYLAPLHGRIVATRATTGKQA